MNPSLNRQFRSSFPSHEQTGFRTGAWASGKAELPTELEPYHPTLLHAFAEAARLEADRGITLLPERENRPAQTRSYRELYHGARRIARGLRELGVSAGDRVLLVLPTSFEFVEAFFAVQLLRAIPVPAYPPTGLRLEAGLRKLAHIANHSQATVCVTCADISGLLGDLGLRAPCITRVVTAAQLARSSVLDEKFRASASEPAFLQYTSGSTGKPKGVTLTHDNLVSNIHTMGQALEVSRNDVVMSWCPLYHDMGLIGALLFAVYWRLPFVLMSPTAFLARPHRWLRAISDYRATLSPAPNFGYALAVKRVSREQREGLDLSSWRVASNGAEPVNLATVEQFVSTYAPHGFSAEAILPAYGLAEVSLAAAFPEPHRRIAHQTVDREQLANGHVVPAEGAGALTLVSVGRAVPGQGLAVVDEHGRELSENQVGHVVVSGRSVMRGYWGDAEATAKVLREGSLWTGDLGYVSDGQLYVTGRAKDLIILQGRNYYAEDLERAAETVEGVRAGATVAFAVYDDREARDLVVLVCETRISDSDKRVALSARVAEAVLRECGVNLEEVVLTEPGAIPKTSSGKRQRNACRQLYLSDSLMAPRQTKLDLGGVFVRSGAGYLLMQLRQTLKRRREPA